MSPSHRSDTASTRGEVLGAVRSRLTRRTVTRGLLVLIGLGVAWIAVTAFLAAREAKAVQLRMDTVRILVARGDMASARHEARGVGSMASTAHRLTTGPAWWIAAQVPYFGRPFEIARGMTAAAHEVGSEGLPLLLHAATELDPQRIRIGNDAVDLAALKTAGPQIAAGAAVLDRALSRLESLPTSSWLSAVDTRRAELGAQLSRVSGYVDAAARVTRILPAMLGDTAPKRYFVALQNEAEWRGTGGLPGAFAIAEVNHGKLKFTHFESDTALLPEATHQAIPTGLDFGKDYLNAYGASAPTVAFLDSNVSPHFAYAAQIWARMWQLTHGEHIDGAIAVDPTVLSYLLTAAHASSTINGIVVNGGNVISLTERDQYALFADQGTRKQFVVDVLHDAANRVVSGEARAVDLADAVAASAQQHRFLVWSSDPSVEKVLQQTDYAATIPPANAPLSAAVINDAQGGKVDYYITRSLVYQRSGCGARRDVTATLTLTNNAPAAGLPDLVTERLDRPAYPTKPGDAHVILDYYATGGAQLQSVTVDGKPATAGALADLGHPIFRVQVELPRGTKHSIVFHLSEPGGVGQPVVWQQPGVNAMDVTMFSQACR